MVTLLAKIFIQEKNDQAKIREEYGVLCGVVGILFNVLLFAGKFLAGTISHSIAITADAVNNLSDAGSSIVTLAGFKLAGTKPDPEHPFGHGRIEFDAPLKLKVLYSVTEVPTDAAGKKKNTKEVDLVAKLFDEIAPKYADRNGGYTRIVKIGQRKGDGALEVLLELV